MQSFTSRKRSGLAVIASQKPHRKLIAFPSPPNSSIDQSKGSICGVLACNMKAWLKRKKITAEEKNIDKAGSCKFGTHKIFYWDSAVKRGAQCLHTLRFWDPAVPWPTDPPMTEGKRARKSYITHTTSWKQQGWKTQLKNPWRSFGGFVSVF